MKQKGKEKRGKGESKRGKGKGSEFAKVQKS